MAFPNGSFEHYYLVYDGKFRKKSLYGRIGDEHWILAVQIDADDADDGKLVWSRDTQGPEAYRPMGIGVPEAEAAMILFQC